MQGTYLDVVASSVDELEFEAFSESSLLQGDVCGHGMKL